MKKKRDRITSKEDRTAMMIIAHVELRKSRKGKGSVATQEDELIGDHFIIQKGPLVGEIWDFFDEERESRRPTFRRLKINKDREGKWDRKRKKVQIN